MIDKNISWIVLFYFFCNLSTHFVSFKPELLTLVNIFTICIIFVFYKKYVIYGILFVSIISILSLILSNSYAVGRLSIILNLIVAIFLAKYMYDFPEKSIKSVNIVFSLFLFVLLIALFNSDFDFASYYILMNDFFVNESRNIVSAVIIFLSSIHLILSYILNKKPSIILLFIGLFFNILLYGRSGIALQLILCAISFISFNRIQKIFVSISVFLLLLLLTNSSLTINNRFSENSLDTPRYQMNKEFIDQISLNSLFTGANLRDLPTASYFDGNPHNTFVYYNLQYNIILIFMVLFIFIFLAYCFSCDKYLFLISLVVLLRINLDSFVDPLWLLSLIIICCFLWNKHGYFFKKNN